MPDPAKKSCTIRELARHVGLSTCTVSRVLNHRSGELPIPEKTQERIREAARALNYVPNVNAQRFFKRRSNVIGLLVPPQEEMGHNAFNDTHFVEILSGIEKALCRTGYNLLLLFNRPEFQENNHYAGLFQSGFLDGLLIWGVHRSDRYWNELAALSGPRIFLTSPERKAAPRFRSSQAITSTPPSASSRTCVRRAAAASAGWRGRRTPRSFRSSKPESAGPGSGFRRRRSVTATIRKPTESGLPPNCWQPADTTRSSQPLRSWRAAPRAASPPGILPPRSDASTARAAPVLPQTVSSPH